MSFSRGRASAPGRLAGPAPQLRGIAPFFFLAAFRSLSRRGSCTAKVSGT